MPFKFRIEDIEKMMKRNEDVIIFSKKIDERIVYDSDSDSFLVFPHSLGIPGTFREEIREYDNLRDALMSFERRGVKWVTVYDAYRGRMLYRMLIAGCKEDE